MLLEGLLCLIDVNWVTTIGQEDLLEYVFENLISSAFLLFFPIRGRFLLKRNHLNIIYI